MTNSAPGFIMISGYQVRTSEIETVTPDERDGNGRWPRCRVWLKSGKVITSTSHSQDHILGLIEESERP